MNFYDFTVLDAKDTPVDLSEYKGKVVLVVNTATECGFTPQYDDLQDLYEKYASKGFEILDFPCNQFGNQAPGSIDEIVSFCDAKFHIKFRHFAKIDVNGSDELPLYKYLKGEKGFQGFAPEHTLTPILESMLDRDHPDFRTTSDIKWNFTKFLIDRNGNVIKRFEPTENMSNVEENITALL